MFSPQVLITILASLAFTSAKPINPQPHPEWPEAVYVLKPDNSTMEQFEHDFLALCPHYYGKSEATDRPIWQGTTFQERFEKDLYHGRKAAVQCIYQVPTAEYINIGLDVAMELGGDGIVQLDPIEIGEPTDPVSPVDLPEPIEDGASQ